MPRSRKRNHSHSRSRSRSHSHERNRDEKHRRVDVNDQDGKRRKIEGYDSPHQKRSVSAEPKEEVENVLDTSKVEEVVEILSDTENDKSQVEDMDTSTVSQIEEKDKSFASQESTSSKLGQKLNITPNKVLSPKQMQKRLESEKKRVERQKEKDEKDRLRNEEKEKIKQEKLRQKQEKDDQKKKEREMKEAERLKKIKEKEEQKKKEIEEKEQKKREKEEKEEQKRKEKEIEKIKKQQELEEKNKGKNKQQQKTAAAFVNFFVAKKADDTLTPKKSTETEIDTYFKPFEVKSDMKLPLERREPLSESCKDYLVEVIENQDEKKSYLKDLKEGKKVGKCDKTWPYEEETDVIIIEEETNLGETIYEDKTMVKTMRAKYLKFHENRRPAYHGTWRKKSPFISGRKPFGEDKEVFDYEVDSDDDWEEEEQGESIENGSDDEEKENEPEEDYEVDNEFLVPHGHLSDDEIDDEETSKLSPEDLKQKLKLLKDEFDQDIKSKTQKLKPRSIGCVWYNKDGTCDEEAIDRYLKPLAIISQGQIIIKKRSEIFIQGSGKKKQFVLQELDPQIITMFLKLIHGNTNKKRVLVEQFLTHIANENHTFEVGKGSLYKYLNLFANWKKCTEDGPLKNKHCWIVSDDIQKKYKVALTVVDKSEN